MIVQGYSFHQGVVDNTHRLACAEAINYLDFEWLNAERGGLRVVYEFCRWLRNQYSRLYLTNGSQVRPALRAVMFEQYLPGVRHFLPISWSHVFFSHLRDDIASWCNGGKEVCLNYEEAGNAHMLTRDAGRIALTRLAYCIETMEQKAVQVLHASDDVREQQRLDLMKERPQPVRRGRQANESRSAEVGHVEWNISIFNPPTPRTERTGVDSAHLSANTSTAQPYGHSFSNGDGVGPFSTMHANTSTHHIPGESKECIE